MAEVFLARQAGAEGFEKLVVPQAHPPPPRRDKQFVEMFLDEARLAAQLEPPEHRPASTTSAGRTANYFIAMEYIDGPTCARLRKRAHARGDAAADRWRW